MLGFRGDDGILLLLLLPLKRRKREGGKKCCRLVEGVGVGIMGVILGPCLCFSRGFLRWKELKKKIDWCLELT